MGKHTKGFNVTSANDERYGNKTIGDSAATAEYKELRKKVTKRKWLCKKWVATNVEFEFQLWRGDEKFPKTSRMTVYQAGIENNKFAASFAKRLDREKPTRLWSWKMVDSALYGQAIKERMHQFS